MALRRTLSHRPFRRLWFGQLASRIGDSVHEIALIWVVYEVTGDPTLLSLTFAASFVPTVLLSLPAGAVVDRVNRKYVLVGSDLLRAATVLVIPFVGRGPLLVPTVLSVAFVTGVADAVDGPARGAFVPRLVPEADLDGANSLIGMTSSLSQVLFAAGGVVVAAFGSFAAFYVDAGTFLVSALFVATISSEHGVPDREGDAEGLGAVARNGASRMARDVRSVLGFVRERPVLRNVLALGVVLQFAVAPVNVALPVYAPRLPISDSVALGVLYSAFFTGMTAGMVGIGRFDDAVDAVRGRVIVAGMLAFGVCLAAGVVVAPDSLLVVAAVVGLFAVAGLGFAAATAPRVTLAQLLVPDQRRGRYTAVANTLGSGAFVVGLLVTGPLVGLVGARVTLVGVGVAAVASGVVVAFLPLGHVQDAVGTNETADESAPGSAADSGD
ncbi:MFS transporter [Halobacterium wangiae]|uniref:MFS transporter n=1 Tax=Halobacterium wangiae TaxID=2902623 RepID=UPI001E641810|nr:MFS transporter [Halobacterium wangiae]